MLTHAAVLRGRPRTRVLVVDDDGLFRALLCVLLVEDGRFDVVAQAENGVEALALVDLLDPDAVLVDFDMPVMNGLSLCEALQARRPEIRLVMLTGSEPELALEAGARRDVIPLVMRKERFDPGALCELLAGAP